MLELGIERAGEVSYKPPDAGVVLCDFKPIARLFIPHRSFLAV